MARRKPKKTRPSDAGASKGKAEIAPAPPPMGSDFRVGLAFFALFELGTYVAVGLTDEPWLTEPKLALWRNAFLAASAVILTAAAVLWVAGARSQRSGLLVALSVVWLIVLTGRLATFFLIAGSSAPLLLTLFVGQLASCLMAPAAIRERRKATA